MVEVLKSIAHDLIWDAISKWLADHKLSVPVVILYTCVVFLAGWLCASSTKSRVRRSARRAKRWLMARISREKGSPQVRFDIRWNRMSQEATSIRLVNDGDTTAHGVRAWTDIVGPY